jgi:hypothetical protein
VQLALVAPMTDYALLDFPRTYEELHLLCVYNHSKMFYALAPIPLSLGGVANDP